MSVTESLAGTVWHLEANPDGHAATSSDSCRQSELWRRPERAARLARRIQTTYPQLFPCSGPLASVRTTANLQRHARYRRPPMSESADRPATRAEALTQLTAAGQPYELIEVDLFGSRCRAFRNAPPTLRDLYEGNRSDATFFVYEDERYSYDDMWQAAARVATVLTERYGVVKGDRVAISMRNYPEWIMTFTAVTSIGAIAVAMNALWQPEELEYGLNDSGAKVLFADQERLDRMAAYRASLPVEVIGIRPQSPLPDGVPLLDDMMAEFPNAAMPAADIQPNDDATILYTSGSTGHPKGAVSCHRNILSALLSWELDGAAGMRVAGITPQPPAQQPATLLAVPLFHVTGLHAILLGSYRAQRRVISMYKWDVERGAELIERERISSFIAPAAMTGDLTVAAVSSKRDLSSLVSIGGGGAPRAPEQVKDIAKTFSSAQPGTGWGMTETNAIGTGIGGPEYLARPSSSGRCAPVLDMRIVGEDGAVQPPGERGEVQVHGTSVIRGYWNREDANAETFDGRWLRTGDVGYLDDEGYLFIVDRIKDLVIRGGENVGCGEVEAAILEHPDVVEASVYGVPDDRLGEEVGATVFCSAAVDEGDLRNFLADRLAKFKIPRYLRFAEEPLPRIASGKILKRQLRDEAARAVTG